MIHTTCSKSSSFNLPTCLLTPSFQKNPLLISPSFTSCCCCCCCCANSPPIYNSFPRTKSINPSFLCNGLRQSTLIQFSPTKRLIFHGRRRLNSNRSSGFCLDSDGSCYYEKVYSFERRRPGVRKGRYACWGLENERKEQIFSDDFDDDFVDDGEDLLDLMNCEKVSTLERRKQGGARKGRYACWGVENKRKEQIFSSDFDDDCVDDVENLLDLLNEEVGLDYLGVKERKKIEITDSSSVKRDSMSVHRVAEARSRQEEDGRRVRNEGREDERVNREHRKEGSSCSSYYSVSEFESDNDVEMKQDGGFVKSSNEYKDDRKQVEESEILKRNSAEKYYGNQEWRKKSEKKLNVESSQHESHLNTDRNRQQDSEIVNEMRRSKGSRVNSQKILDTHVKDEHRRLSNVIQETSTEVSGRVEDRRQEEHQRMDQMMISKGSRVNLQKISDTHIEDEYRRQSNVISEACSSSLREARMKNWEERSTEVSGRVEDRRQEEHERTDQMMISKGSRVNLQKDSGTHVKDEYRRQSNVISSSSSLLKNWEEKTTEVSGRVEDRRQEHERTDQMMISKGSRVDSQKISDTRVKDEYGRQSNVISEASSSLLESRMKKSWEEKSTEVSGRVEDRRQEEHQRMDQVMISQGSRVNSQKDSDTRVKDEYRRQSNVISEASSSSLRGRVEDRRQEEHERTDQVMISKGSRVNSQKDSDTRVKDELKRQSNVVSEASSSSLLEARMKNREETSTEDSGRVEDRRQEHQRTDQMMISKGSRAKPEKTSDTRVTDTKNSRVSGRESERRNQESHFESSTSAEKASMAEQVKFSSEETMKTGRRTTKASSFNVGMPRESFTPYKALKLIPEPSVQEPAARDSGENRSNPTVSPSQVQDSEPEGFEPVPSGDAIASADEQHKSSSQFVGEFVNKAKNELSEAQSEKPKPHEEEELYEDAEQHELKSSGRGPSDEMWHETGNGEPVKKSGRSLWNVIGDVVRLRWASPRSEAHTPKSGGGKAMSNQSTGSDAWFSGSGHEPEPEDYNEESTDTKTTKGQSRSKKDASDPSSSTSPLPGIRMRRSPVVKGDLETGETDAPSDRGKLVIVDQPVAETYSKDGELKRRKLGRMDQVSKDRFDEWEEAYTVETEQRRTDELFMREALSEAKKAADFWEVPVGAVLVQDGKVIARGYNLVEELRDSTAHAEMICIREASNYLRSWRLSGTTLYVTLEPCPMCAGAILQARVDTVVWGAPNKLLGADGSWIRLFPDGDGGGNGSDKPGPPAHPFHPNMTVRRGVLSSECADVMQQFFQLRRKKKEKRSEAEPPPPPPPSSSPPSPPSSSCLPITHHHHHHPKLFSKMHDVFSIMFCL